MTPAIDRRRLLQSGLALGVGLASPATRACEFFSTHLRITHPWARASLDNAGTAVVCLGFDQVRQADRLIGVHSPVASGAQLAGAGTNPAINSAINPAINLPIPSGQDTLLSEDGTHILLTGLTVPLEVGRQYPLQLVFERGGVIDASLSIDYARFA